MEENIKINKIKPFWNNQCLEISNQLWFPTDIDSHSNFWNGSSEEIMTNSWFSMMTKNNQEIRNSQIKYTPSYMFIILLAK